MAENIIKDFVKKQTTPLTIGVPKQRPQAGTETPAAAPVEQPVPEVKTVPVQAPAPATAPAAAQPVQQAEPEIIRGHVGRPKSDVEKVKLSVYVPAEMKSRLIKVQHHNYKPSLNDVLIEAIADLLTKYGE